MTTNPFTDGRARTLNIVQRLKTTHAERLNRRTEVEKCSVTHVERITGQRENLVANRSLYNPPTTGPINGASLENTQEDTQ